MSTVRFFNLSEPVVPLFRDLGSAIVQMNHQVEFVVSRSSYRGGDGSLAMAVPEANVVVTRGPKKQFASRLGRAVAMVFYWAAASWRILTAPRPAVNVFLTQPPVFVGLGVLLAKLSRQPCVIVVMDLHPDELVAFGVLKKTSLITRAADAMMRRALGAADRVVVIGRCMRDRVVDKGVVPANVTVIPNWVDDKSIEPVERNLNDVRKALGWGNDFVVMYGGNVGYAQEFSTLIDVAGRIGPDEGIRLVVIGDGSNARVVREGMNAAASGEYHPLLHQSYSLAEVLSAADVHFISLREECTGLGVPSKTYAAMAAGRPVIFEGSRDGEVYRAVTEHGIGEGIDVGDGDAFLAVVRRLAADQAEWRGMCERSRAILEAEYTAEKGVQRYLDVLHPWLREVRS